MPKAHVVYTGIYGFYFEGLSGDRADVVWALAPDARGDLVDPHLCWAICHEDQRGAGTTLDAPLATEEPWRADAIDGLIEVQDVGSPGVELWQDGVYNRDNLVPLERSHPDGSVVKLKDELLTFSDDALTTCKARIRNGFLDVTYVDRRWKWKFTHQGGPPRFLAQEVCHHFDLQDGESLKLRLGNALLELESQQGEDVVVILGNTPEKDIFPDSSSQQDQEEDHHVKLFNRVAARPHDNPSPLIAVPVPRGEPDPRHAHRAIDRPTGGSPAPHREEKIRRVHGANCPPGTWEESG